MARSAAAATPKVVHETRERLVTVVRPQHGRRVDRREDDVREVGLEQPATASRHAKLASEERLRRSGAQENDTPGRDRLELGLEPWPTGDLLAPRRLVVDPPRASRLPLEVLHGVRHVRLAAVDPRRLERPVEHSARGADERLSGSILLVAGLLADEHEPCARGPRSEDGLGRVGIEGAAPATLHGLSKPLERPAIG